MATHMLVHVNVYAWSVWKDTQQFFLRDVPDEYSIGTKWL